MLCLPCHKLLGFAMKQGSCKYPHKRVLGAKENRAAWVMERRGGSHPGARFASAENDLRASLKTKDMCEPAPSENEEL